MIYLESMSLVVALAGIPLSIVSLAAASLSPWIP